MGLRCLIFCFVLAGFLSAVEYFVDTEKGDDKKTGLSKEQAFRTVSRALSLCVGTQTDAIRILPSPFPLRESIGVSGKNYPQGMSLTIDGGGNWITGSEPILSTEWKAHESLPDVYVFPGYAARFPTTFLVVNGKVVRMGRARVFAARPLPQPENLSADEWTISGNDLLLRIRPGYDIREYQIERGARENGVAFYGSASRNVVVSNLKIKFVTNDGINLHCRREAGEQSRDISFNNVDASWNWDEGISAHDRFEYTLSNSVMLGNNCGIVNIESAKGIHHDLLLADSPDIEFFFYTVPQLDEGSNVFINSYVCFSKSWRHLVWRNNTMTPASLRFERSVLHFPKSNPTNLNIALGGIRTSFHQSTLVCDSEKSFSAGAFAGSNHLEISDSLFLFRTPTRLFNFSNPDAGFQVRNSLLAGAEIVLNGKAYSSKNEGEFRDAGFGDDKTSLPSIGLHLGRDTFYQDGRGADLSPAMKSTMASYLDGTLQGAGFALVKNEISPTSIRLHFNRPVDVLSQRAGIRVFQENGKPFLDATYVIVGDGSTLEIKNLQPKMRVEVNENLLSTAGPLGLSRSESFLIR